MTTDAGQAPVTADDGFHEIQLSGKQLVFLFMTTTVVAIVIFLCGVLVGRGARLSGQAEAGRVAAATTGAAESGPAGPADAPATGTTVGAGELTYYERLGAEEPPAENVKSATEVPASPSRKPGSASPGPTVPVPAAGQPAKAAVAPADAARADRPGGATGPVPPATGPAPVPATPKAPAPVTPAVAPATPGRVPGGYAVQVAALKTRGEADAVARRLTSRGYDAYVVAPSVGSARVFRVRVGSYKDLREAERIASRLQREEKFKPWITR